ncbi:DNA topoisomerase IB [Acidisoma sp.]|uniref:DNA topoisomerase IB n=1 Tax=Acidisoma sp. TaxID=1872115 RepID=UPI003AFFD196
MPRTRLKAHNQPAADSASAGKPSKPRRSAQLKRLLRIDASPEAAAAEANLHYVNDGTPGIARHPTKEDKVFSYTDADGRPVTDAAILDRIRKLAIPPAYRDVWICPDADGHLQATGKDARGRRQYRYHPRWREVRDEAKFGHMMVFANVLPKIRRQVEEDLSLPGLPRKKVLAAIVRLLETTLMRVGNEEYAQTNNSFGITTLRNRHVKVRGKSIVLDFRGKHGVTHHIDLEDARLARIVSKCQHLPGQELFQFVDHDELTHAVGSSDVNHYLQEISGADITAKDFRTWAGTNLAALALQELAAATEPLPPKKSVLRAIESVSKLLGNTPAICRKCYIHPAIFEGYLDGSLLGTLKKRATEELEQDLGNLKPAEAAVTGFLAHRLVQAVNHPEAEPQVLAAARKKQARGTKSSPAQPAPRIEVAAPSKAAANA